jgi:molybdenum cofactor guanylyltransferase
MAKHQKHPELNRRDCGIYAPNELAVLGTSCTLIKKFCESWANHFSSQFSLGYQDADHKHPDENQEIEVSKFALLNTDKITLFRRDYVQNPMPFDHIFENNRLDLLFVNGNHFVAKKQILIIDPVKEASILKRIDHLTDIQLVILNNTNTIYESLMAHIGDKIHNIPIVGISETKKIHKHLNKILEDNKPPVKALILAGGLSTRMGQDKAQLILHNKPQWEYLIQLCSNTGLDTRLSLRIPPEKNIGTEVILDAFPGKGPMGAILSAFEKEPNVAWLVLACDLPNIDQNCLKSILSIRNSSKYATAFHNENTGFPDPLLTIYEPKSYMRLLQFLAFGYACPRKMLINSDIHTAKPDNPDWLINLNTPEDLSKYTGYQVN